MFGVAHEKWIERPVAAVVLRPDAREDERTLREWLAARVATWWLPDPIVFTEAIPRTGVGKFLKRALRERYANLLLRWGCRFGRTRIGRRLQSGKGATMMKTMLATRQLGASDLHITAVGFGAWAIGGANWKYGWGDQDDEASVAAIRRALDLGVNWIDTAHAYGAGYSEVVVGRALADVPKSRRPYVFTKCAQLADKNGESFISLEPASLREECEGSLKRLGVEAIDLYQIHWPTDNIADIDAGWSTLADLQREGKVRYIGVSNFDVDELERARAIAPVTSLQPPYNPIRRDIESGVLPYCREHGIGVIAYAPMASGLLTGAMTKQRAEQLPANDWRSRNDAFKEPALSRNLALVEVLRRVGERHGRSPGEVAIAWTLRDPVVTGAIVGARGPQQVDGWINAASFRLAPDEIAEIGAALP